jgi:hypothetical protein
MILSFIAYDLIWSNLHRRILIFSNIIKKLNHIYFPSFVLNDCGPPTRHTQLKWINFEMSKKPQIMIKFQIAIRSVSHKI